MTELMEKVFTEVAKLQDEDQDYIAALIQRELTFDPNSVSGEASEPESIHALLKQAREEIAQGKVYPLQELL